MRRETLKVFHRIAKYHDSVLRDWRGSTLREALASVDYPPVVIYWGCWTKKELDEIL